MHLCLWWIEAANMDVDASHHTVHATICNYHCRCVKIHSFHMLDYYIFGCFDVATDAATLTASRGQRLSFFFFFEIPSNPMESLLQVSSELHAWLVELNIIKGKPSPGPWWCGILNILPIRTVLWDRTKTIWMRSAQILLQADVSV